MYTSPSQMNKMKRKQSDIEEGTAGRHIPTVEERLKISQAQAQKFTRSVAAHPWHDLEIGSDAPKIVNAIIEIPKVYIYIYASVYFFFFFKNACISRAAKSSMNWTKAPV